MTPELAPGEKSSRKCTKCGKTLPNLSQDIEFCPHCGQKIERTRVKKTLPTWERRARKI